MTILISTTTDWSGYGSGKEIWLAPYGGMVDLLRRINEAKEYPNYPLTYPFGDNAEVEIHDLQKDFELRIEILPRVPVQAQGMINRAVGGGLPTLFGVLDYLEEKWDAEV